MKPKGPTIRAVLASSRRVVLNDFRRSLRVKSQAFLISILCVFASGSAFSSSEPTLEILKVSPSLTDGKPAMRMESNPPVLTFPPGQEAGESVVELVHYASIPDAAMSVSVKKFKQMTLQLKDWGIDEYFHIIEGDIEITNEQTGKVTVFSAGDAFVIPRGYNGVWKQLSDIHIVTVMYGQFPKPGREYYKGYIDEHGDGEGSGKDND